VDHGGADLPDDVKSRVDDLLSEVLQQEDEASSGER
jgi:hypothetical protein